MYDNSKNDNWVLLLLFICFFLIRAFLSYLLPRRLTGVICTAGRYHDDMPASNNNATYLRAFGKYTDVVSIFNIIYKHVALLAYHLYFLVLRWMIDIFFFLCKTYNHSYLLLVFNRHSRFLHGRRNFLNRFTKLTLNNKYK